MAAPRRRRRNRSRPLSLLCQCAAVVIEVIRVNTRVWLGLSLAHLVSLAVIVVGICMLSLYRFDARTLMSAGPPLDATLLSRHTRV